MADGLEQMMFQPISQNQLEFHHQLLQDYYAAEALRKRLPTLSDEHLKRDYLNYLKWTEPLALMLAIVDQEAEAMRVVRLAIEVDRMLAARLAGEVQPAFQPKTVGAIAQWQLPPSLKVKFLGATCSESAIEWFSQPSKTKTPMFV